MEIGIFEIPVQYLLMAKRISGNVFDKLWEKSVISIWVAVAHR